MVSSLGAARSASDTEPTLWEIVPALSVVARSRCSIKLGRDRQIARSQIKRRPRLDRVVAGGRKVVPRARGRATDAVLPAWSDVVCVALAQIEAIVG
jgi:hypothetical protein